MQTRKIHIIGSVGSGKTTFARKLSNKLSIVCYELDNVVWKRREDADVHDVKRTPQERDDYFSDIYARTSGSWKVFTVSTGYCTALSKLMLSSF
ncbi:hypothetical protein [Virgibacillus sp. DJP39]|uniref:hypothetical protein n=1 Tax=Virgibacillus sp. DJP39 TaxID=3409790 RepID=UPI003BB4E362